MNRHVYTVYTGLADDLQAVTEWVLNERGVDFFIHRTNLRLLKLAIECCEPVNEAGITSLRYLLSHIKNQGVPLRLEDMFFRLSRYCAESLAERVTCE